MLFAYCSSAVMSYILALNVALISYNINWPYGTKLCYYPRYYWLHMTTLLLPGSLPFPSFSGCTIFPSLSSVTSTFFVLVYLVDISSNSSFSNVLIKTNAYMSKKIKKIYQYILHFCIFFSSTTTVWPNHIYIILPIWLGVSLCCSSPWYPVSISLLTGTTLSHSAISSICCSCA